MKGCILRWGRLTSTSASLRSGSDLRDDGGYQNSQKGNEVQNPHDWLLNEKPGEEMSDGRKMHRRRRMDCNLALQARPFRGGHTDGHVVILSRRLPPVFIFGAPARR